jgi:hypothetical protein
LQRDPNVDLLRQFLDTLKKVHADLNKLNDGLTDLRQDVRANTREVKDSKKKLTRFGRSWAICGIGLMSSKTPPTTPGR